MIIDWKWITALTLFMATVGCSQPETPGVKETATPAETEVAQSQPAQAEEKIPEPENHKNPTAPATPKPVTRQQQVQTKPSTPSSRSVPHSKPASPAPVAGNAPREVSEVLQLVNKERAKNNLPALSIDPLLQKAAMLKAQDMRDKNYFAHQSPTYGSPFDLMAQVGIKYSFAAENIAAGQRTATEVMQSWMNSSGHRANILNKNYSKIGIGFVTGGTYRVYWTQEFIKS